jgi:hypothetical protein
LGANAGFSFPVGIEGSGALVFVTERSSADGQAETTVSRLELNSNSPEKLFSLSKVRHRSAAVNTAGDLVVVGEVAQGAGAPIVKAYQFSRGKLSEVFSRQLPSGQEVWLADSVIDDAGNTFMSVKTLSKRSIGKSERLYAGGSISQGALTALSGAARRRLNSFDAEPFGLSAGMLLLRTNQGVRMADVTTPARFKGTKGGSRLSDRDAVQNARGGVTYLLDEPFSRPLIIREVVAGEAPRTYICRGLEKLASEALLSCVTCMTSTLTVKVR